MEKNTQIDEQNLTPSLPLKNQNINFSIEEKKLKELNKILLLINKIYFKIISNENNKLNAKAMQKYKKNAKRGIEDEWIKDQLQNFESLNELNKYFSSREIKKNYLKFEPINYKNSSLKNLIYQNKVLYKKINFLINKFAKKIEKVEYLDNYELSDQSVISKIEINHELIDEWNKYINEFKNSFNINRDLIKSNKNFLIQILKQNRKLERRISELNIVEKKVINFKDSKHVLEYLSPEDNLELKSIILKELNKSNFSIFKNNRISSNKLIEDFNHNTNNFEKKVSKIKLEQDKLKNDFEKFKEESLNLKFNRIADAAQKNDSLRNQLIKKINLIIEKGEKLSINIDDFTEKLRRLTIDELIAENGAGKIEKKDLIISFAALKHPKLNYLIDELNEISTNKKIDINENFSKQDLKNEIENNEKFYEKLNQLNLLINKLEKNQPITNNLLVNFPLEKDSNDNYVNTKKLFKNNYEEYKLEEILNKKEYKNMSLKEIFKLQTKNLNILLDNILEIQGKLLQKLHTPDLAEVTANIDINLSNLINKNEKSKNEKEKVNFENFAITEEKKISGKVNLIVKNQHKFLETKLFNSLSNETLEISEEIINHEYIKRTINENLTHFLKSIEILKIRNKELFRKKIQAIEGFIDSKRGHKINYEIFDINTKKLNNVNKEFKTNFYNDENFENLNNEELKEYYELISKWSENFSELKEELNQRMSFLIVKYNYLAENINEVENTIKLVQEKPKVKKFDESEKLIINKVKELEKQLERISNKKIKIESIKGVGPKTKEYFASKWEIHTVNDLIAKSNNNQNEVFKMIKELPGLNSEKYAGKVKRFNNFLAQAHNFVSKIPEEENN